MTYIKSRSFFLSLILLSASFAHAKEEEKKQSLQEEITEYIYHHVQDSHDFYLFSTKDKKTGEKIYYGFHLQNSIFQVNKIAAHLNCKKLTRRFNMILTNT